jgi:glutathione S-transferase
VATAAPIIWAERKINKATADAVRADLQRLPGLLDHVDLLLAQGVIGGAEPNAADYQIGTSVRLLLAFDQIRPLMEGRLAADFALRLVPHMPGHIPGALPPEWIPAGANANANA